MRNNVIDDDEQQHNVVATTTTGSTSNATVSSVTLAGPSASNNATENSSSAGRFLLHANFPSLFESNNRHDESVSGNGDASNESATPGMCPSAGITIERCFRDNH